MRLVFLLLLLLLALVASLSGCAPQVFESRALQPNPISAGRTVDQILASVPLYIYRKDVQLGLDYQLRDSAQFVAVDRNRLRFQVTVVEREESDADSAKLVVWLVDAAGRRYEPDGREGGRMTRIQVNVRPYAYRPAGNRCSPPPCFDNLGPSAFEVYQGKSDFVFRADGLAERASGFTLHVQHLGVEQRYSWTFGDGQSVQNYGRTETDALHGVVEIPGPGTQIVATKAEGDSW